jgi:GH18 family chitinase
LQQSGNGDDYKRVPNSEKAWEIEAYPILLQEVRDTLGANKLISSAVPGLERDMIAFTAQTTPKIASTLDFLNVMTYDLMNRRDSVTKHHTGVFLSLAAVDAYISRGAAATKLNLGLAFYAKWFKTEHCVDRNKPIGCPTELLEDPETGADMGRAGSFSWHDSVPADVAESFSRSKSEGIYDDGDGSYYYWDPEENIWWTYDTPQSMLKKFSVIVKNKNLGGVFAWGLGEDAQQFEHLKAISKGLALLDRSQDRHDEL